MFKAIIIEDSRLARNELKLLISKYDFIDLIGEAENADIGLAMIKEHRPDLMFLDINMPGKSGFELLEELEEAPVTIFTTAYDEFAIKSFEYNTLDYLLKPINEERFDIAIQKLVKTNERPNAGGRKEVEKLEANSQIFVKDGEKCWFIKIERIEMIESEGNYSRLYFDQQKALVQKSLSKIAEKLPDFFFRVNRQEIVNINFIDKVVPWFSGQLKLTMKNGKEIEVSRRQSSNLKNVLAF